MPKKRARPDQANAVILELVHATAAACRGKHVNWWVSIASLKLTLPQDVLDLAALAAEEKGWAWIGGRPPHSICLTHEGRQLAKLD